MFSNNNFQFLNSILRILTLFFYLHIFLQIFLNNNFQFLNICISLYKSESERNLYEYDGAAKLGLLIN